MFWSKKRKEKERLKLMNQYEYLKWSTINEIVKSEGCPEDKYTKFYNNRYIFAYNENREPYRILLPNEVKANTLQNITNENLDIEYCIPSEIDGTRVAGGILTYSGDFIPVKSVAFDPIQNTTYGGYANIYSEGFANDEFGWREDY